MELLSARARARRLRRPRAGLAGRHAPPGARAADRLRDRRRSSSRSLFPGNDLPGVMLSGGAVRLAALYGAEPGHARGGGHRLRPRARGGRGAARPRRGGGRRGRPARRTARATRSKQLMRRGVQVLRGRHRARGRGPPALQRVMLGPPGAGEGGARRGHARLRPAGGLRRQRAGHLAARRRRAPAPATTSGAATSRSRELPDGRARRGRGRRRRRARRRPSARARVAGAEAAHALGFGDEALARARGRGARGARPSAPAAPRSPCRRRSRARGAASASPACART